MSEEMSAEMSEEMSMAVAAPVFDVGGTLSVTEAVHRPAFDDTFAGAGLPRHWDVGFYRVLAAVSDLDEPGAPYRHLAGSGDGLVTVEAIARWRPGAPGVASAVPRL
jgi:phosphoglycolate phosphatase-like HAD superfamily hydrolase